MFQFLRLCAALLVVAAFPICVNAQTIPQQSSISDPGKIVKWSYSAKETAANEYDLLLTATIQKDWTVYSQNLAAGGPVPTSFRFDKTSIQTVGAASENSEHTKNYYEPVFKMQIIKYADRVTFVQHIKALKPTKIVTGSLRFMTCNDRTCLPPSDLSFSISLPAPKVATVAPIASAASNVPSSVSSRIPNGTSTGVLSGIPSSVSTKNAPAIAVKTPVATGLPALLPPIKRLFSTVKQLQPKQLSAENLPSANPVKWSISYHKSGAAFGVSAKAVIQKGWYVLASLQNENTVLSTSFSLADKNNALLESMNERGHRSFKADANFQNKKIAIFEDDALFSQHLQVKNPEAMLQGAIVYTVCNSEGCLPTQSEKFNLKVSEQTPIIAAAQITPTDAPADAPTGTPTTPEPAKTDTANSTIIVANTANCPPDPANFAARYKILKSLHAAEVKETSALVIFLQGFLGGLIALFTPCVFPLIPMTVSFFLNRSKTRNEGIKNAFLYGLSIILIYVFIGIILTTIFGAAIGNTLATHWIPNLLFFAVFTVFAFSFLGYFELTLPSTWANKTDAQADKGGFLGIFFMALTLVIVSFSCTGPVLGTLLVQAVTSNNDASFLGIKLLPLAGMLGFSSALALPFGLFALFPTWLKSLPKSGGWMNTLKVNFAFIELLLAVKFLSNIDLVYFKDNAAIFGGILRWEPFLILWALLFLGTALYNFGFIRFPHDDKNADISWGRKGFGLFALCLTAYSVFGLVTYDPLSYFSGLTPPPYYNFWNKPTVANTADCPLGIACHRNNLDEAIEAAAASGKPLFIDFTGDACVNCRKTENNIWTLPQIKPYIQDSMILVSLICDSREEIPETAYYKSCVDGREVNRVGKQVLDLEMVHFNEGSQPLYVPLFVDPKEHHTLYTLNAKALGYPTNGDVLTYENYLKEAMANFRKIKAKGL